MLKIKNKFTSTVLFPKSIPPEPVTTSLARFTGGVVNTSQTSTRCQVTAESIADVNVIITLAQLASTAWNSWVTPVTVITAGGYKRQGDIVKTV